MLNTETKSKKKKSVFGIEYRLVLPAVGVLAIVTIFPFIYTLIVSMHKVMGRNIRKEWPWNGFQNFIMVMKDEVMWNSLFRTLEFIVVVVIVELVLGFILALIFNRESKVVRILRTLMIVPMIITPVVVGLMWKALLKFDGGLINNIFASIGFAPVPWLTSQPIEFLSGLPIIGAFLVDHLNAKYSFLSLVIIDIWQWTPYVMLIILSSLQSIPREILEAAEVDGANSLQVIFGFYIPLLKPAITVILLLRTIDALKVFDTVYALYGSAADQRLLNVHVMNLALRIRNYGQGAAISILILIGTSFVSQQFVKFLNRGAINE